MPIGYTYVAWPRDDREKTIVNPNGKGILDKGYGRDVEKRSEERGEEQASQARKEGRKGESVGRSRPGPPGRRMDASHPTLPHTLGKFLLTFSPWLLAHTCTVTVVA